MTVQVCVMNEEIARNLLNWEDFPTYDNYILVKYGEVISSGRWETLCRNIYKHEPSGTFWAVNYLRGNTEYQDPSDEIAFYQVEPKEKTITVYVGAY